MTKLAILSDVHITAPGEARHGKLTDIFAKAVARAQALKVDNIVLLGDTVENGLAEEYVEAKKVVAMMLEIVRPLVGNHELMQGQIADFRRAWNVEPFTADLIENLPVMRLNSALGNQPANEWHGHVSQQQLDLLQATLDARPGKPAIIFSHHPLKDTVSRSEEAVNHFIDNSPEVRKILTKHGAPCLVISGHNHAAGTFRDGKLNAIGLPSLGYWPHAFLILEISTDGAKYETHRIEMSPEESPDADAIRDSHRVMNEGIKADQNGYFSFN